MYFRSKGLRSEVEIGWNEIAKIDISEIKMKIQPALCLRVNITSANPTKPTNNIAGSGIRKAVMIFFSSNMLR
ncbi:hypothetical protein VIN01S_07450 [Vibrio inusitatus NBRC 102082]|uniref:Uncharacterized protein n=1 Tax=Vibrio inusitatus NBRC 102082 TaxID=1219070 RepID=A0A4Y3HSM1_9VIBR|nr:hypothetical protein VIN01S_07450 [Vibrio inusitatus NBRC 102082]